VTFWTFVVYTLAICGVPLTSGFLSKDEILAGTLAFGGMSGHVIIPVIGFLVAGLTAFYMFRVVILAFLGDHKDAARFSHLRESPMVMTIPLVRPRDPVGISCSIVSIRSTRRIPGSCGQSDVPTRLSLLPWQPLQRRPSKKRRTAAWHRHAALPLRRGDRRPLRLRDVLLEENQCRCGCVRAGTRLSVPAEQWYFDEIYQAVIVNGTLALSRILRWFDGNIVDGLVNGTGLGDERDILRQRHVRTRMSWMGS